MALTNRFLPHSVFIAGLAAWINQIQSTGVESGVSLFEESSGSETDREFVAAKGISPSIPIATSDLSLLSTIGFTGVALNPGGTATLATVYGRELPLGGLPTAIGTDDHVTLEISDGLIVPTGIRASHNSVAMLSLMLHAILGTEDGAGDTPIVRTAGQTIPSGASQLAHVYTTGPVKYTISGGSSRLCLGISDLAVDFGIQVLVEGDSGDVYPTHVSIIARMTKMMFTIKDFELITEIGDGVSVSAFAEYFQNVKADGQRVPPATATHVAITGTAGMITPGAAGLTHKQAGTAAFTFTPAKNTNLIAISVTAAIPTS